MSKRMIAWVLAVLVMMQLGACAETPNVPADEEHTEGTDTSADTEEVVDETTQDDILKELLAEVPGGDYDGYSFNMLNNESNYAYTLMTVEDLTSDKINDAIYNRNIAVADKLKIRIVEHRYPSDQVTTEMDTCIMVNEDTYACFWNESKYIAPFAIDGMLVNVHDIATIDLENPWWYSQIHADVQFGEYLYFLVGDLHLMFNESYWMCGFNKDILDEHSLEDPYELVRAGTWTFDRMKTYMDTVDEDLDGNGIMDGYDRFGVTCYPGCVAAFAFAAGETFVERNAEGVPELKTPDDRFYAVYEKIVDTMFAPENKFACVKDKTKNLDQYKDGWHGVFRAGHALFYLEPIGSLKKLRDMEAEFGIVPFPKYDEAQENYITNIADYAAFCGIPVTASDTQRTGVILENLCAYSYGDLRQAYVETTLNFKYIRDQESAEMMQIILESGRFCLTNILDVTSLVDAYKSTAVTGNMELASSYARATKIAGKLIPRYVKKLMKLD